MADLTPLRTCTNEAEFNAFLTEIADEITKEEVQQMKFLCLKLNSNLPRGRLDEIEEPREFVTFLRRRDIISPGNVGFLTWLLDSAENKRLANMISDRGKQIFQFTVITRALNRLCCPLLFTRYCKVLIDHGRSQRDYSLINTE